MRGGWNNSYFSLGHWKDWDLYRYQNDYLIFQKLNFIALTLDLRYGGKINYLNQRLLVEETIRDEIVVRNNN